VKLLVDTTRNVLHLVLIERQSEQTRRIDGRGALDIGPRGRLIGFELLLPGEPPRYLPLEESADPFARTAEAAVTAEVDEAGSVYSVEIPRRGPDFEISYPSGNQCWYSTNPDDPICVPAPPVQGGTC
jgi:uncharacterized protein YuzE